MSNFNWSDDERGSLTVDGMTLEYQCHGPSPRAMPTIVMLHEGLGCIELWRDFPKKISEATGYGVFVYSRPGYGKSDCENSPWSLDYMAYHAKFVLPKVLNELSLKKFLLLGHSDGASISALYAGNIEDHRLLGIILLAPHFFAEDICIASIEEATISFNEGGLKEKLEKYHINASYCFTGWSQTWLDPSFRSWDITDCIDYFRVPVLAIQGEDDQYGTMRQLDEIAARCYSPLIQLRLKNCRHSPQFDQSYKTVSAISSFCERLSSFES